VFLCFSHSLVRRKQQQVTVVEVLEAGKIQEGQAKGTNRTSVVVYKYIHLYAPVQLLINHSGQTI